MELEHLDENTGVADEGRVAASHNALLGSIKLRSLRSVVLRDRDGRRPPYSWFKRSILRPF